MSRLALELDERLRTLAPEDAAELERLVREALATVNGRWPEGYFEATSGALAGEPFERPAQGEHPKRVEW